MLKATALAVGCLLVATPVMASPMQLAQAQSQSQMDAEHQKRLEAAKTPEEKAKIQAEYDKKMMDSGAAVRTAPGTAGSGALPDRGTSEPQTGQSPTGGSAGRPAGQGSD